VTGGTAAAIVALNTGANACAVLADLVPYWIRFLPAHVAARSTVICIRLEVDAQLFPSHRTKGIGTLARLTLRVDTNLFHATRVSTRPAIVAIRNDVDASTVTTERAASAATGALFLLVLVLFLVFLLAALLPGIHGIRTRTE
jgi:hypothetical protein